MKVLHVLLLNCVLLDKIIVCVELVVLRQNSLKFSIGQSFRLTAIIKFTAFTVHPQVVTILRDCACLHTFLSISCFYIFTCRQLCQPVCTLALRTVVVVSTCITTIIYLDLCWYSYPSHVFVWTASLTHLMFRVHVIYYLFLLQGSGRLETVHELSRALGRPFYWFNCHSEYDGAMLHNVFKGLAQTGKLQCNLGLYKCLAFLL